jgi:hypothetical protein
LKKLLAEQVFVNDVIKDASRWKVTALVRRLLVRSMIEKAGAAIPQ